MYESRKLCHYEIENESLDVYIFKRIVAIPYDYDRELFNKTNLFCVIPHYNTLFTAIVTLYLLLTHVITIIVVKEKKSLYVNA